MNIPATEILVTVSADAVERVAGTASTILHPEATEQPSALHVGQYADTTLIAGEMQAVLALLETHMRISRKLGSDFA